MGKKFQIDDFRDYVRKFERNYRSKRAQTVLGFLAARGFLIIPGITPQPRARVAVSDLLWVAEQIEPRVLEVFPLAFIHYPKSFTDKDKIPPGLQQVIQALKLNLREGPNFGGIPFETFRRAADIRLEDRRLKPLEDRKVARTFRLKTSILKKIKEEALARGISEAAYVESRIA
ncbi:MAG: hypothetical protein DCC75_07935 [Proteobacteria bacterium]|nr:MAG: hypothetical protein DCC75_07935 [Pseudomonadota bacterium]